jgi:hypothetical protein
VTDVSVVVVVHDVARQAARTLFSLSAEYQRHIDPASFEIVVVDNGSDPPLDPQMVAALAGNFRLIRVDPAPPSPAHAINRGLAEARGEVIGVMIDGARIVTPGLLHFARHGARLYDKAVVAALGWYIGHDLQGWSVARGHDRAREDALLESIAWPADGYRLFEIGTMDESSLDGWFQPISESSAVFARRELWDAIGGVDERFDVPGGGLLNLDTFARLLGAADANLVVLLGEATFHQVHGGVNTNAPPQRQPENFARWAAQYAAVRGQAYAMPAQPRPPTYIGTLPQPALARLARAAIHPLRAHMTPPLGRGFRTEIWARRAGEPPAGEPLRRLVDLAHREFAEGHHEASCAVARLLSERAPAERGLDRLLALVAGAVTASGPSSATLAEYHQALGEAHEILGERDAAAAHYRAALESGGDLPRAHLGLSRLRMPGEDYLQWLRRLYDAIAPKSVVEIGVFQGASLALLRPPTIAIAADPNARVLAPLRTEAHLFAETSDEFFARGRVRSVLGERAVSVAFIDGLHLFEQTLRDFINLEALCGPDSAILIHDTVPLDEATATRTQATTFYTGDVWKVVLCLKQYRPDLDVFTIATAPTGLTVVSGLDPRSNVLRDAYDTAVARFVEMPFSSIADDLCRALNVVPNDWSVVESRLKERHIL